MVEMVLFRITELSNRMKSEQNKYMEEIRTSVRQFGHDLDTMMQMLHESTTKFLKSFMLVLLCENVSLQNKHNIINILSMLVYKINIILSTYCKC